MQIMQVNSYVFNGTPHASMPFDLSNGRLRVVDIGDDGEPVTVRAFPAVKEVDFWEFVCDTFEEAQTVVAHILPLREKYDEEVAEAKRKLDASCYLIADVIE
jgi:hypothetical protein